MSYNYKAFPTDLERIFQEINSEIKEEFGDNRNRCGSYAKRGIEKLNQLTKTNDFRLAAGALKINHYQTNPNDLSEGWYWGWIPDLPDSREDEIHFWILNDKKNYLIDFNSGLLDKAFMRECNLAALSNQPNEWKRIKPLPKFLYERNYNYTRIRREHGLDYREVPALSKQFED